MGFDVLGGVGGGAVGGVSTGGNTAGNTGTVGNQIVYVGGSNITLSQATGAGGLATVSIIGGAGFTEGVSTGGNTAGTTGTVSKGVLLYGGANITLSQSSGAGGATISVVGGAGVGAFQGGVSTGGNTSGNTKTVASQIVFVGGNNVTLSQATNGASATITISGPSGGGAGMSTQGNTAGTTGTVGMQLIFVGGSNITLSQSVNGSSGSLTIIGASGGSAALPTVSMYPNPPWLVWTYNATCSVGSTSANGASTHSTIGYLVQPLVFNNPLQFSKIQLGLSFNTSDAGTGSATIRHYVGLYSISSDSLTLASSWMAGALYSQNSISAVTLSVYTGSDSNTVYSFAGNSSAAVRQQRYLSFGPGGSSSASAGHWWAVVGQHTISASTCPLTISYVAQTEPYFIIDLGSSGATGSQQPLLGAFSSTSSTNVAGANQWLMPPSVATSAITATRTAEQIRPQLFFRGL